MVNNSNLCKKYDISLDKLSFEYVSTCKDVKEIERIVKILRSGEEGHYTDLQKHAENKLKMLAPNSRVLRVEEPIIQRDFLMPEERDQVDNDMKQWIQDMSTKDEELVDWNKNYSDDSINIDDGVDTSSGNYIPPIRRASQKKSRFGVYGSKQEENSKKLKKPVVSDYSTWDKYDADSELLKIDAEDERKRTEEEIRLRKEKAAAEALNKKKEQSRLNCLINSAKNMPDAEKSFLALAEKDRGNEYYKTCNYDDAIEYYTASITICPNPNAYNNRAACYLKQGKYDLALSDVKKCLELDPENTKGLYRRGLCLQHKNKFDEALQDMQAVLRKEPHNLLVQHVAKELRQQCHSVPRSVRMLVEQEDSDKVVEVSETEAKGMKAGLEVNEWGLARNMCSCYGRPPFLHTLHKSGVADHLVYKPVKDKKENFPDKMSVEEEDSNDYEVSETEAREMKTGSEVNDWGLPRKMCNCYGCPSFVHTLDKSGLPDPEPHVCKPEEDKKKIKKKSPEIDKSNLQNRPEIENVTTKSPVIEMICNGDDANEPMETNRIPFSRNIDNEADELIPKKIQIIEIVKTNGESSNAKEHDKQKKLFIKDMRGQQNIQGQKESEIIEQLNKITVDGPIALAASKIYNSDENKNIKSSTKQKQNSYQGQKESEIIEQLNKISVDGPIALAASKIDNSDENKNIKSSTKQKQNSYQENTDKIKQSQSPNVSRRPVNSSNSEFQMPAEKQPVTIASKYTQRVVSSKNINAQNDTSNDQYFNINNNSISNINSSENVSSENFMTPYQFSNLWLSVKDTNSLQEYASILRRIQPSRLQSLIGNKLDGTMLLSMLKTLSSEFDVTNPDEAELIKQYLVTISSVERFIISLQFIQKDVKKLTNCLIDKVGGEDAAKLKKMYDV